MLPSPPQRIQKQRHLESSLQSTEEDQVAAHSALKFLWAKVRTHKDWQAHVQRRDHYQQQVRATSAARAREVRQARAEWSARRAEEQSATAAERAKQRSRVRRDPEAVAEEKDMRYRAVRKRRRKEPTAEELEENAAKWVSTGNGGYSISELNSAPYMRAMMKAELARRRELDSRLLEMKKENANRIRFNERLIMKERAGVSARYHLPVKPSQTPRPADENNEDDENNNENDDEENEYKGRRLIPGCTDLYLPEFHKTEAKTQKHDDRRMKKVMEKKIELSRKQVQRDVDAAAKLLILHAHMLRKQLIEAKKKEDDEEGEDGDDQEAGGGAAAS